MSQQNEIFVASDEEEFNQDNSGLEKSHQQSQKNQSYEQNNPSSSIQKNSILDEFDDENNDGEQNDQKNQVPNNNKSQQFQNKEVSQSQIQQQEENKQNNENVEKKIIKQRGHIGLNMHGHEFFIILLMGNLINQKINVKFHSELNILELECEDIRILQDEVQKIQKNLDKYGLFLIFNEKVDKELLNEIINRAKYMSDKRQEAYYIITKEEYRNLYKSMKDIHPELRQRFITLRETFGYFVYFICKKSKVDKFLENFQLYVLNDELGDPVFSKEKRILQEEKLIQKLENNEQASIVIPSQKDYYCSDQHNILDNITEAENSQMDITQTMNQTQINQVQKQEKIDQNISQQNNQIIDQENEKLFVIQQQKNEKSLKKSQKLQQEEQKIENQLRANIICDESQIIQDQNIENSGQIYQEDNFQEKKNISKEIELSREKENFNEEIQNEQSNILDQSNSIIDDSQLRKFMDPKVKESQFLLNDNSSFLDHTVQIQKQSDQQYQNGSFNFSIIDELNDQSDSLVIMEDNFFDQDETFYQVGKGKKVIRCSQKDYQKQVKKQQELIEQQEKDKKAYEEYQKKKKLKQQLYKQQRLEQENNQKILEVQTRQANKQTLEKLKQKQLQYKLEQEQIKRAKEFQENPDVQFTEVYSDNLDQSYPVIDPSHLQMSEKQQKKKYQQCQQKQKQQSYLQQQNKQSKEGMTIQELAKLDKAQKNKQFKGLNTLDETQYIQNIDLGNPSHSQQNDSNNENFYGNQGEDEYDDDEEEEEKYEKNEQISNLNQDYKYTVRQPKINPVDQSFICNNLYISANKAKKSQKQYKIYQQQKLQQSGVQILEQSIENDKSKDGQSSPNESQQSVSDYENNLVDSNGFKGGFGFNQPQQQQGGFNQPQQQQGGFNQPQQQLTRTQIICPGTLNEGESICSQNQQYWVKLNQDGNLNFYNNARQAPQDCLYCTNVDFSFNKAKHPVKLEMRNDGNVALIDSANFVYWETQTAQRGQAPYMITVLNEGDCVIYDSKNTTLWSFKEFSTRQKQQGGFNQPQQQGGFNQPQQQGGFNQPQQQMGFNQPQQQGGFNQPQQQGGFNQPQQQMGFNQPQQQGGFNQPQQQGGFNQPQQQGGFNQPQQQGGFNQPQQQGGFNQPQQQGGFNSAFDLPKQCRQCQKQGENPFYSEKLPMMVKRTKQVGNVLQGSACFDDFFGLDHQKEFHAPEISKITVYYTDRYIVGMESAFKATGKTLPGALNQSFKGFGVQSAVLEFGFATHIEEVTGSYDDFGLTSLKITTKKGSIDVGNKNIGTQFKNLLPFGIHTAVGFGGSFNNQAMQSIYLLYK
ncbi:Mannose-binding lectin [Pseudocohnilembus persalinus]|uniref:Mannose-binding lectin n=1 Tax=Pseudocohnilembus persalinus TaxID=266149 RepID=A0A0V0QC27_PSEPJ|nr:Mannose-binding lectin [Pseudocohnilembus persalinus]|eukprot:KRW99730.1 Mannose-binding lectin [Pseudocohnilembus persalinus]